MSSVLGLDTSNYTTSVAVLNTDEMTVVQQKKLLPVKEGELGLRQSDAVFHHTKQLGDLMKVALAEHIDIKAIGVSTRPRNLEGSYMPCFLVGEMTAECCSAVTGAELFKTSHQIGHILSALFSCKALELVKERFIAFHVSGGTTDCLLVEPSPEKLISITEIGTSLDLKAGQAVDRVGVMLGLQFPCGKELEKLALRSEKAYKIRPSMKENNCCLSGLENKCSEMLKNGESSENIARFCIDGVLSAVRAMAIKAQEIYGKLPIVCAGGVMSNSIIRQEMTSEFGARFAEPEFSCDNAVGTAVFSAMMKGMI